MIEEAVGGPRQFKIRPYGWIRWIEVEPIEGPWANMDASDAYIVEVKVWKEGDPDRLTLPVRVYARLDPIGSDGKRREGR